MNEYENPNQEDPYTYYASTPNTPSEYRYVPQAKKKKKKQPWVLTLILVLCCSLLSGAMGVGGVLLMQHLQAEAAPGTAANPARLPRQFPLGKTIESKTACMSCGYARRRCPY